MCASFLVLGAAVALALAGCGGGASSDELTGVGWRWTAVLRGADPIGLSPIPDPANYLLRLDEDGTFTARADCKSVTGTYSLSGSELALDVKPPGKNTCGKSSRADEYIALLRRVASYDVYDEGALALGLENDTGQMYFYVSSEQPPPVSSP